jgi:branched-chain amino acid transport system substrate-binding protein
METTMLNGINRGLVWIITSLAMVGVLYAEEAALVGVLHSESYPYAAMMKNSFEMAMTDINRRGGVKGQPLKLEYANDAGNRKAGENAVEELIAQKNAKMLVGAYQSSNTIHMARVADEKKRPLLVSTAADDRITQRKWLYVYRMNPPASGYTEGMEAFLLERVKPQSIGIVYENSPYGTGGALQMMWFCRENNIDIRAIVPYHKERLQADYFRKILAPFKINPPDVIYMVSYLKDAALLVDTINALEIKALLCGGAGGFTHQRFIDHAGPAAERLLTATLWTPQLQYPGAQTYYQRYISEYKTPPDYHGAEAYSALLVVADALQRATSTQPDDLRAALDATDMVTPFGPVRFQAYGKYERQNRLPTQVLQIIDGRFECVWPSHLASAQFVSPAIKPGARN